MIKKHKIQIKKGLGLTLAGILFLMPCASANNAILSQAAETKEIDVDTFAQMTIDTDSMQVTVDDESGSFTSQYHLSRSKADQVLESEESLEKYLNKQSDDHIYEVEQSDEDQDVYTVTAPYQEQELIIPAAYSDEVMEQAAEDKDWIDYSDSETTSYSDYVVLSFDSEEETKEALDTIQAKYGDNACYANEVLKVDFMDDEDSGSSEEISQSGAGDSTNTDQTGSDGTSQSGTGDSTNTDQTGSDRTSQAGTGGSTNTDQTGSSVSTGSASTEETSQTETSESTAGTSSEETSQTGATDSSQTTRATEATTETTITPTVKSYTCKSWGARYMGMESLKNQAVPSKASQNVLVAVIDTGVDKKSTLFSGGRISSLSYNFYSNSKNVTDTYGHGTHVAGIIADSTPTNVKILSLKIMDSNGYTTVRAVMNALSYAIKKNVAVINMSISLDASNKTAAKALNKLINRAYAKGIPICAAAGNSGVNVKKCYPASNSATISVSSITDAGKLSSFSNYGSGIDFCAPGSGIVSAYLSGKTAKLSGTSMASPHIAAAIAYIKMLQSNLSVSGVISELKSYCVDLGTKGKDSKYGYGYPKLTKLYSKGITYKSSTAATTLSSVTNVSKGVSLKWKKISGITSYAVYRKSGSKYIKIATTSGLSYTDKKVKNGSKYSYYIASVKSGQIGKASAAKSITRLTNISKITLKKCSAVSMQVLWGKLSKLSGVEIQISQTKTFKNPLTYIAKGSVKSTVIKNIVSCGYYVRARKYKGSGSSKSYSAWSTVKSINLAK